MDVLLKPQEDLNYTFLLLCYVTGSIIAVILCGLDIFYKIESIHGYWIIFAPCFPCIFWAYAMRKKKDSNKDTSLTKKNQ